MSRKEETLTYKQNMSKTEVFHVIKAIGCPLIVFGLGIFTISNFANFGTKLICPAAGIMWFLGFFVALLMPSQRKEVLNQTLIICNVYFCTLLGFKVALGIVSGVSAEMIAASFNQSIPTSTGNAMPGYLQNLLWFSAIGIPIGQVGMQGKRLLQFHHNKSLQKTFGQKRGMRDSGNGNSRMI